MPNTRIVKSYKVSGMQKYSDGGVAAQGYDNRNTTYPHPPCNNTEREGEAQTDTNLADDAPINIQYREKLPDTIEPLGSVNLSSVSLGGKKS